MDTLASSATELITKYYKDSAENLMESMKNIPKQEGIVSFGNPIPMTEEEREERARQFVLDGGKF